MSKSNDSSESKKSQQTERRLNHEQQRRIMTQHFESYLSVNCPQLRGEIVDVIWKNDILKIKVPGDTVVVVE